MAGGIGWASLRDNQDSNTRSGMDDLHALEAKDLAGCGLPAWEPQALLMQITKALADLTPVGEPTRPKGSRHLSLLSDAVSALEEAPPGSVLLHGDLSPEHVLVAPRGGWITGIIDWGDAMWGDPARDFIFLLEDWGEDFLAWALEGYGRAEDATFLQRVRIGQQLEDLAWSLSADPVDDPSASSTAF
jgi:aminoglycoside phosphotransferase (APT) family kinase protein